MSKFCQNPLCRCHLDCAENDNRLTYQEANGKRVDVRRFFLVSDFGTEKQQEWTFCEICANVLAITNGTKNTTNEPKSAPTAG